MPVIPERPLQSPLQIAEPRYGIAALLLAGNLCLPSGAAQAAAPAPAAMDEVVISASRAEQTRFDAPAAVNVVTVDALNANSPLVNLSELLSAVPGVQVRERQNYAQDLQISARGFGTRATFGVRGVRLLVDGIPITMPDGQGQAATASLTAATRVEVLRGPLAQTYGNSAGGVVQIFTRNPPQSAEGNFASASVGAGSDGQRQSGIALGGGNQTLGAVLDVAHYKTDGYRDHSAADRNQATAKLVFQPSSDTKVTTIFNSFELQAQDPLGLTRTDFERNSRQVVPGAIQFDTRKTITQQQAGVVFEQRLSEQDNLSARAYNGTRQVFQTLAQSGAAANSSGGVVNLDRDYGGLGMSWRHQTRVNGLPMHWVLGVEDDILHEMRRGYVNNNGIPGALRRDESDHARDMDWFAQFDWTFLPDLRATAGVRASRVKLFVNDHYITAASPNDSGQAEYSQTSPVAGLAWSASDTLNLYTNIGRGFETPTLTEVAYSANNSGPNLGLKASSSVQAEVGAKMKYGAHAFEVALFASRSKNEIVPSLVVNGRSVFQNVDGVQRRGVEGLWQARFDKLSTQVAYTWLDASFRDAFANTANSVIPAGNRLPGAPQHSLYTEAQYQFNREVNGALEMRTESKVWVNDINSESAPGYAVLNARAGYSFRCAAAQMHLFARIDNLLDHQYAGSVIVNDSNGRFYEAAPGRRFFVGLRTAL